MRRFSERPDANSLIRRSIFQRGKIKQKGERKRKKSFSKGKNVSREKQCVRKTMCESRSVRHSGKNQGGLKKPPGREHCLQGPPWACPHGKGARKRTCIPVGLRHPFAPVAGLPLARPRSSSCERGSPACCFERCEWSGCPSRAISAVSKSVPPGKQVAQRGLLICACLASSLDIRSTAVTVFRSFESRQRVINAVGCFQCISQTASLGDLFR